MFTRLAAHGVPARRFLRRSVAACPSAIATLLVTAASVLATPASATTSGNTVLSNTATASYASASGQTYTTVSNTVTTTVQAVGAFVVSPQTQTCSNADAFGSGQTTTRTFTVTNDGNAPDAYAIGSAAISAGKIVAIAFVSADGTVVPAAVGATSPAVAPGSTLGIRLTLATTGIASGTNVQLTVGVRNTAATANGTIAQTGSECLLAATAPQFTGPGGINTPIKKLVNGAVSVQTQPGAVVQYTVQFENAGGVAATNAIFSDVLPVGVLVDPASVQFDGASIGNLTQNGNAISVPLGTIAPAVQHVVAFKATVAQNAAIGTSLVNVASLAADGVAQTATTPASVYLGIANVVYDGYVGQSMPVSGAVVTLSRANASTAFAPSGAGFGANAGNVNPFTTGTDGTYGFGLGPDQVGPAQYILTITAPGYLNRRIALSLVPDATDTLFTAVVQSVDGQALAVPGGFALTTQAAPVGGALTVSDAVVSGTTTPRVVIPNIYGLFGNLPLFRPNAVQIVKTVDRSFASAGDRLVYTLTASATGANVTFGATTITDPLPPGLAYAPGTGRLDGAPVEPARNGRTLIWSTPSLGTTPHVVTFATVVLPGIDADTTLTNSAAVAAASPSTPSVSATASSQVDVQIVAGVFSNQTVVTGRVFADRLGIGRFRVGDVGLPNVRVFLESGESALTDANGRFDFPATSPGMHVLRVDETTLPPGTHPYPTHAYDDERSTRRLVHGPFDAGIIQDVNFAIGVDK